MPGDVDWIVMKAPDVDKARRERRRKHGADRKRLPLDGIALPEVAGRTRK